MSESYHDCWQPLQAAPPQESDDFFNRIAQEFHMTELWIPLAFMRLFRNQREGDG